MTQDSAEAMKAGVAGVFDRAAATYDQVGVDFFRPVGRFLVSRTDPRPGERVLDVGCGRGASALPAAEAVGPTGSVLATDLAPSMVEALTADLPEPERRPGPMNTGPFASVPAMHDHLAGAGWSDVTTETLVHDVHVRDPEHWFEWGWSQGYRHVLEKLGAAGLLPAARDRVTALLEEMATRDGDLTWRAEVHATLAHA